MAEFALLKGTRARFTRINSCGMPIAGAANRLVTSGFVTVTLRQERRDAVNIEQTNAEGKVCVSDRTPPQRKWWNVDVELCNFNTCLVGMATSWPQVLDWNDEAVGVRDDPDVDDEFGLALEVWTSGRSDDDCPVPTTDAVLTASGSGKRYGYLLVGVKEWSVSSDLVIRADYNSVTLSGISVPMTGWGRGPYNVVATDASNTPGRLLNPFSKDPHLHIERTPIAPPDPTVGNCPEPLAISTIFTSPNFYYGPTVADVAPDQPSAS